MPDLVQTLSKLYAPLIGWILVGWVLGRLLPKRVPVRLGQLLLRVGIPISVISFLYRTDLSGLILVGPATAWVAMLSGAMFAWLWIELGLGDERLKSLAIGLGGEQTTDQPLVSQWSSPVQGSFFLAMMIGNTGYMGFPVVLNLVGEKYFAWALFYDLLGSFFGTYVLGVAIAAKYGTAHRLKKVELLQKVLKNPALWGMGAGLLLRLLAEWKLLILPHMVQDGLRGMAWTSVNLALVLIGMQISQLKSLNKIKQAVPCLGIKMILIPLVVGTGLMFFGINFDQRLALVLQMGMPPAFATVVFAENYGLDRELAVTNVVCGFFVLLLLLPLWIWLFGSVT
ncbi:MULTISPECIES: AEC family transporter [unclassified Leptolyngbya]|uniref:AEC family transporter n=1 Tax=unclassified Leptolyngbya TaxID=2650499 RepID=UPI001686E0BF|nr:MULTISPECIES: AEC family transporter [unclassified Leptolyngbya]MBD1911023.1 AEC family transporter [Leptolyngbya sp. FACHB-8]MBD2158311.1 AEC family transporter [Leptolyngbya sp. FACHB-16]